MMVPQPKERNIEDKTACFRKKPSREKEAGRNKQERTPLE